MHGKGPVQIGLFDRKESALLQVHVVAVESNLYQNLCDICTASCGFLAYWFRTHVANFDNVVIGILKAVPISKSTVQKPVEPPPTKKVRC